MSVQSYDKNLINSVFLYKNEPRIDIFLFFAAFFGERRTKTEEEDVRHNLAYVFFLAHQEPILTSFIDL